MKLPPNSLLVAAQRWLRELQDGNPEHAFAVLSASPPYADLTPTQYMTALDWLRDVALVEQDQPVHWGGPTQAIAVLTAAIEIARPLWLSDADETITEPAELPDDLRDAAAALSVSDTDCLQAVHSILLKVDTELRAELGAWGERCFVALLETHAWGRVDHVAARTDSLGYDVSWTHRNIQAHIEVKTTSRRGRLRIYLSRHEADVGLSTSDWHLVVICAESGQAITALGTVDKDWIGSVLPLDKSRLGRWESVALRPPPEAITPGLPWLPTASRRATGASALLISGALEHLRRPTWMPT